MRKPRDHTRGRRRIPFNFTILRIRELERLLFYRLGPAPDPKDSDIYLLTVAQHFRRNLENKKGLPTSDEVLNVLELWALRFSSKTPRSRLDQVARGVVDRPELEKADALGARLRLTDDERTYLRITTIGACDVNKAERQHRRRLRKRERDRTKAATKRRKRGAKPRAVYLAQSLSASAPWKSEGVSRRTWERRRKHQSGK
jgi:hypothetical protein